MALVYLAIFALAVLFAYVFVASSPSANSRRGEFEKSLNELKAQIEKLRAEYEAQAKRVQAHYAEHPAVENAHIGRDGDGKPCILVELRDHHAAQPKFIPLASEVEGMKVYVEVISSIAPASADAVTDAQPIDPPTTAQAADESVKPSAKTEDNKLSDDSNKS